MELYTVRESAGLTIDCQGSPLLTAPLFLKLDPMLIYSPGSAFGGRKEVFASVALGVVNPMVTRHILHPE